MSESFFSVFGILFILWHIHGRFKYFVCFFFFFFVFFFLVVVFLHMKSEKLTFGIDRFSKADMNINYNYSGVWTKGLLWLWRKFSLKLPWVEVEFSNDAEGVEVSIYWLYIWSFEISVNILRNQKQMICLDSYSRQDFNYLHPILIYIKTLNRLPI